jgi:hypothetical protein
VSAENPFRELIRRVRAGDQDAAAELVRQYEPTIRRVVRVRLTDTRLRAASSSTAASSSWSTISRSPPAATPARSRWTSRGRTA